MKKRSLLTWVRIALAWTVIAAASFQLYMTGGLQLLLIACLWGAGPVLGVQNAVRSASTEAWHRRGTGLGLLFGYVLFWSMALVPAIVAIAMGELIAAFSLAVTIVVGMAMVSHLCDSFFGPLQPPSANVQLSQPNDN